MQVELTLNGAGRGFDVPADASLLELLRDHAGLTSPKVPNPYYGQIPTSSSLGQRTIAPQQLLRANEL